MQTTLTSSIYQANISFLVVQWKHKSQIKFIANGSESSDPFNVSVICVSCFLFSLSLFENIEHGKTIKAGLSEALQFPLNSALALCWHSARWSIDHMDMDVLCHIGPRLARCGEMSLSVYKCSSSVSTHAQFIKYLGKTFFLVLNNIMFVIWLLLTL